jgi:acyl carrier protein
MTAKEKIKEFLEKETQRKIDTDSANLIEGGILDSFSMIKLIDFVEKEFGVKANMEELTPENFNSVETISTMAEKWQKSAQ